MPAASVAAWRGANVPRFPGPAGRPSDPDYAAEPLAPGPVYRTVPTDHPMKITLRPLRTRGVPGRALDMLAGFALGAVLVYLLDRRLLRAPDRAFDGPVDDRHLLGRVRLALAQTIADPVGVDVRVHAGTVILKGPATEEKIAEMVACASRVRGVRAVENRLSPTG